MALIRILRNEKKVAEFFLIVDNPTDSKCVGAGVLLVGSSNWDVSRVVARQ